MLNGRINLKWRAILDNCSELDFMHHEISETVIDPRLLKEYIGGTGLGVR